MLPEEAQTAGSLCSTVVTPLHRSYGPLRNPLLFGRLPGVAGYTTYLAPPISRREEEGFSSCLARPCHRAAATTPPESSDRVSQLTNPRCCLRPTDVGSASGAIALSGPPMRSLALRPGDSQSSFDVFCRWASAHWFPSSLPSKLQGFWLLPWRDSFPLNASAFAGRTSGRAGFPHPALRNTASLRDEGSTDTRRRERIPLKQPRHTFPCYPRPLRAAT